MPRILFSVITPRYQEASDSGLFHRLGKAAYRKVSRVRISPPPPEVLSIGQTLLPEWLELSYTFKDMKSSTKNLLRWIAVLPGALLAGILATFPLHWILQLKSMDGTFLGFIELPPEAFVSIEYALYPLVIALVFIVVGASIAPSFKFRVACALAVLYVLFALGALIFAVNIGLQTSIGIRAAGPVIGIILGLLIVRQKTKSDSDPSTDVSKIL